MHHNTTQYQETRYTEIHTKYEVSKRNMLYKSKNTNHYEKINTNHMVHIIYSIIGIPTAYKDILKLHNQPNYKYYKRIHINVFIIYYPAIRVYIYTSNNYISCKFKFHFFFKLK